MLGMPGIETIFNSMQPCIKNRMYCTCPGLCQKLGV